ncbi:hypothetical protein SEVIR_9G503050v4 [Setaria viridis]
MRRRRRPRGRAGEGGEIEIGRPAGGPGSPGGMRVFFFGPVSPSVPPLPRWRRGVPCGCWLGACAPATSVGLVPWPPGIATRQCPMPSPSRTVRGWGMGKMAKWSGSALVLLAAVGESPDLPMGYGHHWPTAPRFRWPVNAAATANPWTNPIPLCCSTFHPIQVSNPYPSELTCHSDLVSPTAGLHSFTVLQQPPLMLMLQ